MNKLYVGNLPYSTTEEELRELCGQHGEVREVKIIIDRETGDSKGFAFVEFATDKDARVARDALDTTTLGGRPLKVDFARPKERRAG